MLSKLSEEKTTDSIDFARKMSQKELPEKIPEPRKQNKSSKSRKISTSYKYYTDFVKRQKAKGLLLKCIWVKLPKDQLNRFGKWITAQDPDALDTLVKRGSPNDLRRLCDQDKKFDKYEDTEVLSR